MRRIDYNVDCESEDGSNIFFLISLIEKKKSRRENASSAFLVVVRIFCEELQCSSWQIQKILQSSFGFSTGESLSVYFTTSVRSMMSASDA